MQALRNLVARRALSVAIVLTTIPAASWAQSPTTTALSLSSANASAGSVVTLTATVTSGANNVTAGQVLFCNANAPHCEDSAILGSAWIAKSGPAIGSAIVRMPFGAGSYDIDAEFVGTSSYSASTSSTQALTVSSSALLPTTTTLAATTSSGNYIFTATVAGNGPVAPTGTVTFADTTAGSNLASATVGSPVVTSSYSQGACATSMPTTAPYPPCVIPSTKNQAIATGDFNNDGKLDYVIASVSSASVTIMLGNGDGTFTQGQTYSVGSSPEAAVVTDFNGDGNLDIAIASSSGTGVTILLGNGDGTFYSPATSPAVSYASSVAVGDFNGDGIPDLAVANNASDYAVAILLGNGDGTFTAGTNIEVPSWSVSPQGLIAADFNGDGITDLAVTSANNYTPSYQVTILLGNGQGDFSVGNSYTAGNPSIPGDITGNLAIAAGDFNGDGVTDLAVANYNDDTVMILLGPLGQTSSPTTNLFNVGSGPFTIVSGDFNGDGNTDLATANFYGGTLTILFGDGGGGFTPSTTSPSAGAGPDGIVTGDFNGDGLPDFVTADFESTPATVLLQTITSTVTATSSAVSVASPSDQISASYSGDTNYAGSSSAATALSSLPAPTPPVASQTITFPNPGTEMAGGTVTLTATASSGLTVTYWVVSGPAAFFGSTNTLTFTAVGNGTVIVEADQAGNASYSAAQPVRITIQVQGVTTDVTSSTVITAGVPATISLALTPVNGFTGSVSFSCSVPSAMTGASCSASSVQITSSASVTSNVAVNTKASQSAAAHRVPWNALPSGMAFGTVLVAGIGRKKLKRKVLAVGSLAILTVLLMGLASCSGSNSGTSAGSATPSGAYNLTLVATSNKASYKITIPVTVQ